MESISKNATAEELKERIKHLPVLPGVYLMRDRQAAVIYIGKAKNLRTRIRSYFNGTDARYNVQFLLERLHSIDTLVTEDDRQAIILEADLIKKYRPRYNIRLKDDRAFLVVKVTTDHEWPRLELVRKQAEDGARYVGPFSFGYELRTLLEVVKKVVPLRTCSDRVIYNRVRPCLEYQIKRCAAPCCLEVDRRDYDAWVEQAVKILEGRNEEVILRLEADMERASNELRFEDAAEIRDRLQVLQRLAADRPTANFGAGSRDAFGIYCDGVNAEISVLMVRRGRLFEAKTFGFSDVEVDISEWLPSILTQFYSEAHDPPDEILLPLNLEDREAREELFAERLGREVRIVFPKQGAKARLLSLAYQNAKENFTGRFGGGSQDRVLRALQHELGLDQTPRIIECADISHFQGGATVGSIVCFHDGLREKSGYRHFHLTQEGKPDDFASMREIMTRHLSRCMEDNTLADLMVIDGGALQLAQALDVRRDLGLRTPAMIGLAKKRRVSAPYRIALRGRPVGKPERIFMEGRELPVVLDAASDALKLLERIRDEAHRFAITFHRKTRSRKVLRSALENIPGIGPERRRGLLREFGSVKALRKASAEEIAGRSRIPLTLAQRMLSLLNRRDEDGE